MNRGKKALGNLTSSLILQVVTVVCGFIIPKMIIDSYGSAVNGLLSSLTQFLAYITLLEAGFGPVVKSLLYKPIASKDKYTVEKILKSTEKFFRRIALVFIIYIVVLSFIYPNIVKDFDVPFTVSLLVILSISTLAEYFFGMTYSIFLQAKQKMYIVSRIQTISVILNTIIVVVLIKLGCNIQIVKLASVLIFLIRPIFLSWYVRRKYNIRLSEVKGGIAIKQKWEGLAQHVAFVIHNNTDVVVLSIFSNVKEVSVYSVYLLVTSGLRNLMYAIRDSVTSGFGDMLARGEHENLRKKFGAFELFYNTMITIIYSCTIALIVPFVSVYMNGVVDVDYIRPIFAVLIVTAEYVWAFRLPYASLTQVDGHFRQLRRGAFIEAALNIVISVTLVGWLGLVGVAIGTLVAMCYRTIEYVIYATKNQLKCNYYMEALKRVAAIVLETLAVVFISKVVCKSDVNSYGTWILEALKVFAIAVVIVVPINMLLFRDDTKTLMKLAKKVLKKEKVRRIIMGVLWLLPRGLAHKILYRRTMKKKLDLKNPKGINEKIQWLIVNQYGEEEGKLADKILSKEYVEKMNIPGLRVPKTLKVYKDVDDIKLDDLPDKFVLKCNHSSGKVFICTDKETFDIKKAKRELKKDLKRNFAKVELEYHYSFIKPMVMAEEYLDDKKNDRPVDYKFFCYDGYVDCVMVCTDRSNGNYRDFYDKNWKYLDYAVEERRSPVKMKKPEKVDSLFNIAAKISKGFPFVRVDLYDINGEIYFGEMTFTPAAGLAKHYTEEANVHMGSFIDINKFK